MKKGNYQRLAVKELRERGILGTWPSLRLAMAWKAPIERSIEFALGQVGHASAIATITVLPLFTLVTQIFCPQSGEGWERLP